MGEEPNLCGRCMVSVSAQAHSDCRFCDYRAAACFCSGGAVFYPVQLFCPKSGGGEYSAKDEGVRNA